MSDFNKAIDAVLLHEGGFVDHKADPGGATNFGISLRWLKDQGDLDKDGWLDGDLDHDGDVDAADILAISREDAIKLYRDRFWDPYKYDQIASQMVAGKVFDFTVNMGSKQSHKLLQRACRSCGFAIVDDGMIGPGTLKAVNAASDVMLLAALRSEAAGFYRMLCATNPERNAFLDGWLTRAYS